METISHPQDTPTASQFVDLLHCFIRLRPNLILPEHVARFKQQVIESLKNSKMGDADDYRFIIHIIVLLAHRENAPTMGELSSDLNIPLSTATRLIGWLVQSNFLIRFSDPNDRRIVRIKMSEQGIQFYKTFLDISTIRVEKLLSDFSEDEKSQLFYLMDKLMNSLINSKE
jgi:DNA-binding MarR family transcriptional regulator